MFKRKLVRQSTRFLSTRRASSAVLETLEDRRLMSAAPGAAGHGNPGPGHDAGHNGPAAQPALTFSQLPLSIQTALDNLATTDGVALPTATQTVKLGNSKGIETFSVLITGTGTGTALTVDQNGNAVTAPTQSSTTFGAIATTPAGLEISAVAAGLGLTAPATTAVVSVSTPATGAATYTVALSLATGTTAAGTAVGCHGGGGLTVISVDASGNPVGNENVPLGTLSAAVRAALTAAAPAGATALTSASLVSVRTLDGVTTYSATYNGTGTRTTVTVDTTGKLTSLPSTSTTTYSALTTADAAAATELLTLATADGATLAGTQTVTADTEANGTVVYSVHLTGTTTSASGTTSTYDITLSVDQNGFPTIPSSDDFGGPGSGGPGRH